MINGGLTRAARLTPPPQALPLWRVTGVAQEDGVPNVAIWNIVVDQGGPSQSLLASIFNAFVITDGVSVLTPADVVNVFYYQPGGPFPNLGVLQVTFTMTGDFDGSYQWEVLSDPILQFDPEHQWEGPASGAITIP